MPDKPILTQDEVAARYGVARQTVWSWRRDGRMPLPVHIAGSDVFRWRLADLEAWEQQGCPDLRTAATPTREQRIDRLDGAFEIEWAGLAGGLK